MNIIELDFIDLIWAWGFIGIAIALASWQRLGLESQLFLAAGRSLLQLSALGYVLKFIFDLDNPGAVLIIVGIMITIAAIVARNRISKKIKHLLPVVWSALFISSFLTVGYSIIVIIQPTTWYQPQYLIPLVGMILGNTLNGASLAGERLASNINNNHLEIETHLSLGATPRQAIQTYRQEAIRIGLIPILNQMAIVGMVSLPGMFTGQVLAGNDPLDATSYQILILYMIALANLITTLFITEGVYRRFFNHHFQLLTF